LSIGTHGRFSIINRASSREHPAICAKLSDSYPITGQRHLGVILPDNTRFWVLLRDSSFPSLIGCQDSPQGKRRHWPARLLSWPVLAHGATEVRDNTRSNQNTEKVSFSKPRKFSSIPSKRRVTSIALKGIWLYGQGTLLHRLIGWALSELSIKIPSLYTRSGLQQKNVRKPQLEC
jgi:hypothetical protein